MIKATSYDGYEYKRDFLCNTLGICFLRSKEKGEAAKLILFISHISFGLLCLVGLISVFIMIF